MSDSIMDRIEQINEMMAYNEAAYSTMGGVVKIRHARRADGTISSKIDAPKGVKIVK